MSNTQMAVSDREEVILVGANLHRAKQEVSKLEAMLDALLIKFGRRTKPSKLAKKIRKHAKKAAKAVKLEEVTEEQTENVVKAMRGMRRPGTLHQIVDASPHTFYTVRKVIRNLEAQGKVIAVQERNVNHVMVTNWKLV